MAAKVIWEKVRSQSPAEARSETAVATTEPAPNPLIRESGTGINAMQDQKALASGGYMTTPRTGLLFQEVNQILGDEGLKAQAEQQTAYYEQQRKLGNGTNQRALAEMERSGMLQTSLGKDKGVSATESVTLGIGSVLKKREEGVYDAKAPGASSRVAQENASIARDIRAIDASDKGPRVEPAVLNDSMENMVNIAQQSLGVQKTSSASTPLDFPGFPDGQDNSSNVMSSLPQTYSDFKQNPFYKDAPSELKPDLERFYKASQDASEKGTDSRSVVDSLDALAKSPTMQAYFAKSGNAEMQNVMNYSAIGAALIKDGISSKAAISALNGIFTTRAGLPAPVPVGTDAEGGSYFRQLLSAAGPKVPTKIALGLSPVLGQLDWENLENSAKDLNVPGADPKLESLQVAKVLANANLRTSQGMFLDNILLTRGNDELSGFFEEASRYQASPLFKWLMVFHGYDYERLRALAVKQAYLELTRAEMRTRTAPAPLAAFAKAQRQLLVSAKGPAQLSYALRTTLKNEAFRAYWKKSEPASYAKFRNASGAWLFANRLRWMPTKLAAKKMEPLHYTVLATKDKVAEQERLYPGVSALATLLKNNRKQ